MPHVEAGFAPTIEAWTRLRLKRPAIVPVTDPDVAAPRNPSCYAPRGAAGAHADKQACAINNHDQGQLEQHCQESGDGDLNLKPKPGVKARGLGGEDTARMHPSGSERSSICDEPPTGSIHVHLRAPPGAAAAEFQKAVVAA